MSDDLEEIRQLKARYFRLMDTKDWDGLAGVFTQDVEIDVTREGGRVFRDVQDYMPFLRANIGDAITVHHGHMPEIELTSPTTASGIWALEDRIWWPEGSPFSYLHGFGHYHETYAKSEDGWRIATMTISRLHVTLDAPPPT
ncbi:nuclear transport factor 2 family protein [soil metagenome]